MQAEYPKKVNPPYWDRVHVQPRVRKFPDTGESSETIRRRWRPPPEVVQELKAPVPEVRFYDRDYNVTSQLSRSQTCEDFKYKAPETRRFNKHTACTENQYIYPPSRRLTDQPPMCNAHDTTEMRHAYKIPQHPPTLVTEKNQHKHPACLPDPPMIDPSWHKDLEPLDTTYEGYEKYLDPYLTTSRLHHRPYTAEQLSRRSVTKDIVTYHTLSKEPWIMADSTTENNAANVNEVPNNQEDAPAREPARELFFDWPINVVVSEPKILSPDPDIAQQGKNVQKLGPLWKTVRYADTKRQFESTAPFCALLVNHELESLTPRCKSFDMLQRFDQTLAAITHGLLKQRKVLQSALDCLPAEARNTVQNALQSADSQYKKISDDLLQYTNADAVNFTSNAAGSHQKNLKKMNLWFLIERDTANSAGKGILLMIKVQKTRLGLEEERDNLSNVRTRKPSADDWHLPLEGCKTKYERESIRKNSTFSLPKEHVFREIITHNKPKWLPGSFRTEVRDNYVSPASQPGSNIRDLEEQVQTYYQRSIANLQTNAHYEHSTVKEKFASETSQIGTGKPICSVLDQFKEKNKRLQLKNTRIS
ncbi:uncharacterized protein LOC134653695 [Cydia amplana]|uniref:uncharacterized protein LOC134653695 n=1 Tax=Cydia amplana TaxID=1869771 RepID=UPI002FE670A6